jgi:hypothetical protein
MAYLLPSAGRSWPLRWGSVSAWPVGKSAEYAAAWRERRREGLPEIGSTLAGGSAGMTLPCSTR